MLSHEDHSDLRRLAAHVDRMVAFGGRQEVVARTPWLRPSSTRANSSPRTLTGARRRTSCHLSLPAPTAPRVAISRRGTPPPLQWLGRPLGCVFTTGPLGREPTLARLLAPGRETSWLGCTFNPGSLVHIVDCNSGASCLVDTGSLYSILHFRSQLPPSGPHSEGSQWTANSGVGSKHSREEAAVLSEFSSVLNEEGRLPPTTHSVEHHIVTSGRPVTAKFRGLDSGQHQAGRCERGVSLPGEGGDSPQIKQ